MKPERKVSLISTRELGLASMIRYRHGCISIYLDLYFLSTVVCSFKNSSFVLLFPKETNS